MRTSMKLSRSIQARRQSRARQFFHVLENLESRVLRTNDWKGGAIGDQSTPGNWTAGSPPISSDDVRIDANASITVDASADIHDLRVTSGHTVSITTSGTNSMHISNIMRITADSTSVAVALNASDGASIRVDGERFLRPFGAKRERGRLSTGCANVPP
jgi:hypothetical protein